MRSAGWARSRRRWPRSAEQLGVEISLEAPVAKVLVDGGKVAGVRLESGEEIAADVVIANVGPEIALRAA